MNKLLTGDIVIKVCRYNPNVTCIFRVTRTHYRSHYIFAHDVEILWENTRDNNMRCYGCNWYNEKDMKHHLFYRRRGREKVKIQIKKAGKR